MSQEIYMITRAGVLVGLKWAASQIDNEHPVSHAAICAAIKLISNQERGLAEAETTQRLARKIFAAINADPDWDDGYETTDQAEACDDRDLSQEECLEIARIAVEDLQAELAESERRRKEVEVEHAGLRRSEREWRTKLVAAEARLSGDATGERLAGPAWK